jgi:hypothetical protein
MTNNFVFLIIILGILLISLDIAIFSFRKRKYAAGKSLLLTLQNLLPPTLAWFNNQWHKLQKLPHRLAESARQTSKAISSLPSLENDGAPTDKDDLEITGTMPTETTSQQNKTTSDGRKMVHVQFSADIPEGTTINITLEVKDGRGKSSTQTALQEQGSARTRHFLSTARQALSARAKAWKFELKNLDQLLLLATVTIYLLVVSIGIDRYPIYFFTDEAIHMNLASNFIRDGFKNYYGEFLPTFFSVEGWVNGTSVYVQVLPFLIFGKSVTVTRLVSAFISLLGALAIGLLLKDVFKLKYYWAGIFLVLTTPAWFLHSRTAFEYVEVGAFYGIFLYFYGRYQAGHLRSLYWAVIAGALAFYTHGLGQILMSVTGAALFIVDFRYHTHPERRKTVLNALLLGAILLLPFARYYLAHPGEAAAQVKRRGSYWVNDSLTLAQKMGQFLSQYVYGLNPSYWYFPNRVDLSRHIMYRYGNGLWFTLPLVVTGLLLTIKNIRQPAYRLVLIALLACPIPASIVAIGMPRTLFLTMPLALLGMIGLAAILEWGQAKLRIPSTWIASTVFILLAGLSIFMLRDSLVNGPTWFKDYSLYGMQYGAKQVFQDVIRAELEKYPNRRYIVSPSWANGTEQFAAFFLPKNLQSRLYMGQPVDFIDTIKENPPELYFVTTSDEYDKLVNNPEFQDIQVEQMIPFPDGRPGFYVISLKVANNIDQIILEKKKVAVTPVEDTMTLNNQTVKVIHSPLGGGSLQDVFDTNPDTLAKVIQANPFIFDLYLPDPIDTQSVTIQTGSLSDFTVMISLYEPGAADPVTYTETFKGLSPDPMVTMNFNQGPAKSGRIYIEIRDNTSGDTSQIHVRTIQFE